MRGVAQRDVGDLQLVKQRVRAAREQSAGSEQRFATAPVIGTLLTGHADPRRAGRDCTKVLVVSSNAHEPTRHIPDELRVKVELQAGAVIERLSISS